MVEFGKCSFVFESEKYQNPIIENTRNSRGKAQKKKKNRRVNAVRNADPIRDIKMLGMCLGRGGCFP